MTQPQPIPYRGHQRHAELLDAIARRHVEPLGLTAQALLDLLRDLSGHGIAWAGNDYLARRLSVTPRQVRRLKLALHAAGRLAITSRRGKTCLYKVLDPEAEPSPMRIAQEPEQTPPPTARGPNPHDPRPARPRPGRPEDARPEAPLFDRPAFFNPLRPAPRPGEYDNRRPEQRLADAFRAGLVRYVEWDYRPRSLLAIRYTNSEVLLHLADDQRPNQAQIVNAPFTRLAGLKFW